LTVTNCKDCCFISSRTFLSFDNRDQHDAHQLGPVMDARASVVVGGRAASESA